MDKEMKMLETQLRRYEMTIEKLESDMDRLEAGNDWLRAENAKLRKSIQDYLDGNYGEWVGTGDKCRHGHYGYETCERCIDEYFQEVLNGHKQGDWAVEP
jgi:hypothetical protein